MFNRKLVLVLAILIVLALLAAISGAYAQAPGGATFSQLGSENDTSSSRLEILTAGVYIINIGKIDLQTGSYDLDFYFWLSTSDPSIDFTKNKPTFDFMNSMNARIEPSQLTSNYYEVRVKGTFLKNMDFRNYPFDTQQVTVEVEGFTTVDKLVFEPDTASSGYDNLVNVPGWKLGDIKQDVIVHKYPDQSYSRYIFSFNIERSPLSSFLKTIFPVIIITTIAMLAFWMSPTNFAPRIGLAASTLLAAVAAHLNAANALPPIGYLTLMDKVMIVAYALFLNNLVSMVLQMRLIDHKKDERAAKVNAKMRKLMPVIVGILLAVLVPFDLRVV